MTVSHSFPIGVELIVRGLEREHQKYAVAHLRRLITAYNTRPDNPYPIPLRHTVGDPRNAVDYAFLSLEQPHNELPRYDLLERAKDYLNSEECAGVFCAWRACTAQDKSRWVTFAPA